MAQDHQNIQIEIKEPNQNFIQQYPPNQAISGQYNPPQMANSSFPIGQPVYSSQPPVPPQMAYSQQPIIGQNPEIQNTYAVGLQSMPMVNAQTYQPQSSHQTVVLIQNQGGQRRCHNCGETNSYIKGDPSPIGWVLCIVTFLFVGCIGLICLCIFTEQRHFCSRCHSNMGVQG